MASYHWNPAALGGVFILPNAVADDTLSLATAEQLRVLLWFSRHQEGWNPAACAAALGMAADECDACLRFWTERRILTAETSQSAVAPAAEAPLPQVRPAAVKPGIHEVLAYQKQNPSFSALVEAASIRLGKPIGHSDTSTLLYLHNTVGLPMDVILMEIAYAVSIGKPNMRYIEKMALDWCDRDIATLATVDEHIRYLDGCRRAGETMATLLAAPKALSSAQEQLAEKWLVQWGFSNEMLLKAADITREKIPAVTPRFFSYMDKILERWMSEGITTPDKIPLPTPVGKAGVAATNPEESSLEFDDFEKELLRYRPKFNAKK